MADGVPRVRAHPLDALIDKPREEQRRDDKLSPFGIERRGGLGGDNLIERSALLLEFRNIVANPD